MLPDNNKTTVAPFVASDENSSLTTITGQASSGDFSVSRATEWSGSRETTQADSGEGLPIYSPTETESWLRCPVYRAYQKRWAPRGNWTPHRLLGNAIHAGLAAHYGLPPLRPDPSEALPLAVAYNVLDDEYVDQDEWTRDGLAKLIEKGLQAALTLDVLGLEGKVVAVEKRILRCKADLIHREPAGLVVTDWKVKLELDSRYKDRTLGELTDAWQFKHDAWAISSHYGEPVVRVQAGVIVLTGRARAFLHPLLHLTSEHLDNWHQGAETAWLRMAEEDDGIAAPTMNTTACRRYGVCPYYDACHHLNGDETRFATLYDRVEGRK